jgi:site-specific recombinase XerD
MARARKRAVLLETSDGPTYKPVREAVDAFIDHCKSESLKDTTVSKYRNALEKLADFFEAEMVDSLSELKTEKLDQFRAGRKIKAITASKELEILRVFFGFCVERNWASENPAKRIKLPRKLKPNEIVYAR